VAVSPFTLRYTIASASATAKRRGEQVAITFPSIANSSQELCPRYEHLRVALAASDGARRAALLRQVHFDRRPSAWRAVVVRTGAAEKRSSED